MAILIAALGTVVALLALLVAGLLRSHAEILRALHSLGADLDPDSPGTSAPAPGPRRAPAASSPSDRPAADIVGTTPRGDAMSLAVVGTAHPTLVAFLTSGCTTCTSFWEAFARGAPDAPGNARLVIVARGPEFESAARLSKFAPPEVPVVMSESAWSDYEVPTAPYFAYVDGPSGRVVGEGAGVSWNQVVSLIEQALDDAGYERRDWVPRRRRRERGADRADKALLAAGITPGHPSLYGPDGPGPMASESAGG
jgi:hypothetical protein